MEKTFEIHYVLTIEDVQKAIAAYLEMNVKDLTFNHQVQDISPDHYPLYDYTGTKVICRKHS